jgi:hypothetical protein
MAEGEIVVGETRVSVTRLEVHKRDVVEYFKVIPKDELVGAFVRAVEVGTFCLERANASQDLEFVRRQIESMISAVERRISTMPSEVESALMKRIGAGDGQVLAPIQSLVTQTAKATSDRLVELRSMVNEVDPTKEGSSASRVVKNLRDLLDVNRTDSVQATITGAVRALTAADGVLAKTVQATVESGLKGLREEIDGLAKEVRGQDAAVEALNQTTAKGRPFEDEVVEGLQAWARHVGAQVQHVGTDNRPGDVVVQFEESTHPTFRVVIEVRDRQSPKGRKAIGDVLAPAMVERNASGAIYLSRDRQGLANEIGDWAEGQCAGGSFVACAYEHLVTALRFLAVQKRLSDMRAAQQDVDGPRISAQLTRIRTTLDRIKNINRKTNEIRSSATDVESEAALLRSEIREALAVVEESIKAVDSRTADAGAKTDGPKLLASA